MRLRIPNPSAFFPSFFFELNLNVNHPYAIAPAAKPTGIIMRTPSINTKNQMINGVIFNAKAIIEQYLANLG